MTNVGAVAKRITAAHAGSVTDRAEAPVFVPIVSVRNYSNSPPNRAVLPEPERSIG